MTEIIKKFTINLIKDSLNLKPRFCNSTNLCGLSNHYPMMMYSLSCLGASEERILQASKTYLDGIPKKVTKEVEEYPIVEINEENFQDFLGKDTHYFNYLDYFDKKRENFQSSEEYLSHYLNLMPSFLYSEAFHCLIKLGFFIDMNLTEAYPSLLAATATADFNMIKTDHQKQVLPITDFVQKVLENREHFQNKQFKGIIVDRMITINEDEIFANILSHPVLYEGEKTQKELLDILLRIFLVTDNFTMMHGHNSLLAFQKVIHLMKDEKLAFQHYFKGLICAFLTTFPVYNYSNILEDMGKIEVSENLPSFEDIFKAVILSDNDHDAKTVYALHLQFLKNPTNKLFQQKAAKIAKLI